VTKGSGIRAPVPPRSTANPSRRDGSEPHVGTSPRSGASGAPAGQLRVPRRPPRSKQKARPRDVRMSQKSPGNPAAAGGVLWDTDPPPAPRSVSR